MSIVSQIQQSIEHLSIDAIERASSQRSIDTTSDGV